MLARTIRAFASRRVRLAGDEQRIVYRTGMEFVGVERAALATSFAEARRPRGTSSSRSRFFTGSTR